MQGYPGGQHARGQNSTSMKIFQCGKPMGVLHMGAEVHEAGKRLARHQAPKVGSVRVRRPLLQAHRCTHKCAMVGQGFDV